MSADDLQLFPQLPVLPYSGSSGWSGSDTSKARAERNDSTGATTARQARVMSLVRNAQYGGMTWHDVNRYTCWHHGVVSGLLSNLHAAGLLERLTETRDRCQIYVAPEYVAGREIAPYRPNVGKTRLLAVLAEVHDMLQTGDVTGAMQIITDELDAQ